MNNLLQRLLKEATRLTHGGPLRAATEAIQRALRRHAKPPRGAPAASGPAQPNAESNPSAAPIALPLGIIGQAANTSTALCSRFSADLGFATAHVEPAASHPVEAAPTAPVRAPLAGQPEHWTDGSFHHKGRRLNYKLYLPPCAAGRSPAPRPLLLMLHGCTQDPADFAAGTQMNALARKHGFVVLYPAQTLYANAQKCWNWFKPQHQQRGRGEPAALAALTQAVMAEQAIDPARVYVAGLSAGAAMADILGHCYPDLFAAVGVHSGLPTGAAGDVMSALSAMLGGTSAAPAPFNDGVMPPLIVFHGDADATVHPRNGDSVVSAARGLQNRHAQASASASTQVTQGCSAQGQRYTQTVYLTADGRPTVEHWLLHGAGHAWSGGSMAGSYTDPNGADASAEMLRFFMAHPRI